MQQDKLEEGKKREEWSELLKRNARLQEHVLRIDSGNEMQMMNPYLEAMVMVSAAKCLRPEFAPFFLSLSFAELGMDSEKSAAGFLGSSMNRLIDHVTDGLTSEVLFGKKADLAASMVLKKIIKFTFVLAVAGGKLLQEKVRGNEKEKETNELYIKLIFRLSSATDILKIALKELVLATGSAEKAAEDIAKSISSLAFLLMAYSAANKQNFHAL
ncbi:MAG TPA: hypothetical protein PLC42_03240, partial [Parachlamydiaceae bacterium]|nr:hypothetical protein [Parachlamydiaceae bacterium]